MRKTVGILILLAGWITLGLIGSGYAFQNWKFGKNAVAIESHIAEVAQAQIGATTYDVQTSVSGRDIHVSGIVASETERTTILANLDATRGRRLVVDDLRQIEIASPYVFRASKDAQTIVYEGNAPTPNTFIEIIDPDRVSLTLAGGMPNADWPRFVETGIRGISILENGAFEISNRHIVVSGLAKSLEEAEEVNLIFSNLPTGYTAQVDLNVAPTVPYVFTGTKNGTVEKYTGFVPTLQAREGFTNLIGDAANGLKLTAGLPDDNWLSVVGVGINAMKGLNTGTLKIVDKRVEVAGSVNTPEAVANIEGLFSALPEGYTSNVVLTSADDGKPAQLNLEWNSGSGGIINGKGAEGMAMDDLTAALKLPSLGGVFRQGKVDGKENMISQLTGIGDVLPLLESVSADIRPSQTTVKAVLLPGGDMEIAQSSLENSLGATADIVLLRSELEPKEGDRRINEDTGKNEFFQGGFWKVDSTPQIDTTELKQKPKSVSETTIAKAENVSINICKAKTTAFLETANITYETGSATLTTTSEMALAELAEILKPCVAMDELSIEVGGHTDSQGSEEFNLRLSQERAESVRQTLVNLEVRQDAIIAKGFGEALPIASNDTDEGRAQNRRTTITWIE